MLYKILTLCILPLLISCQPMALNLHNGERRLIVDLKDFDLGILRISLPEEHPSSMSIRSPNNDWYIIQDSESSIAYIPQYEFDNSKLMELDINALEGIVWRNGNKTSEKVFKEKGEYLIYFANNLETEPENTFSIQAIVNY